MADGKGILDSLKGSLTTVIIDIVVRVLGGQISSESIRATGVEHGKWITANAKGKLGGSWEGIESLIQEKSAYYFDGVNQGLNSDD
jgi:hypothetical protein